MGVPYHKTSERNENKDVKGCGIYDKGRTDSPLRWVGSSGGVGNEDSTSDRVRRVWSVEKEDSWGSLEMYDECRELDINKGDKWNQVS